MLKALPGENKIFDDIIVSRFYDVILYFRLEKKVKNPNFFVFHPISFKFGMGSTFEMLITKRKPELKLENDLNTKLQFSTDFRQNYTKHSLIIALPWQQWD